MSALRRSTHACPKGERVLQGHTCASRSAGVAWPYAPRLVVRVGADTSAGFLQAGLARAFPGALTVALTAGFLVTALKVGFVAALPEEFECFAGGLAAVLATDFEAALARGFASFRAVVFAGGLDPGLAAVVTRGLT